MKAILLAAAAVAALAFGSCSKADKEAKAESNDFKTKIENCTNPDSIATYVQQAEAYARKLVDEGKVEEAKKYLADIQPIVEKKAPALAGVFETVKTAVDKFPAKADSVASASVESAKEATANAVDSVKNAAAAKANDAVEAAKYKAADAADKASNAANDAVTNAKDKVNNLLGK